jgi:hypothetical protein
VQIKIEIDLKPEELRRFLGLPDVVGLQEDLIHFLREKLGAAASGSFDAAAFVKDNLQTLRRTRAWQRLVEAAKARASASSAPEPRVQPKARPVRRKKVARRVEPTGAPAPAAGGDGAESLKP